MKKKNIMCIAVLIVAAIVSVTVVSCKKDKDEVATKATNSEAQALLNRIEAFQTLRDAVNSGAKADGSMTVEVDDERDVPTYVVWSDNLGNNDE